MCTRVDCITGKTGLLVHYTLYTAQALFKPTGLHSHMGGGRGERMTADKLKDIKESFTIVCFEEKKFNIFSSPLLVKMGMTVDVLGHSYVGN